MKTFISFIVLGLLILGGYWWWNAPSETLIAPDQPSQVTAEPKRDAEPIIQREMPPDLSEALLSEGQMMTPPPKAPEDKNEESMTIKKEKEQNIMLILRWATAYRDTLVHFKKLVAILNGKYITKGESDTPDLHEEYDAIRKQYAALSMANLERDAPFLADEAMKGLDRVMSSLSVPPMPEELNSAENDRNELLIRINTFIRIMDEARAKIR